MSQSRNNSQLRKFSTPLNNYSTALLSARDKLAVSPRVTARPRHYRGTKLQHHVVTKTTASATADHNYNHVNPRHYNTQVQSYKRADRYNSSPDSSVLDVCSLVRTHPGACIIINCTSLSPELACPSLTETICTNEA